MEDKKTNMFPLIAGIIILFIIGVAAFAYSNSGKDDAMMQGDEAMMEEKDAMTDDSMMKDEDSMMEEKDGAMMEVEAGAMMETQ